jgi:hypothetical protein
MFISRQADLGMVSVPAEANPLRRNTGLVVQIVWTQPGE